MALTHILTPIQLGGATIKNRVVRSAHATGIGAMAMTDDLIAYHEARARGGVGLSIIEILSVHQTSPASLNAFFPGIGDGYARLVDAVRPHGMKLFQQIWHGGHNSMPIDGTPPWSASDVPGPLATCAPIAMTKAMIDEIVEAYADAAYKCEQWGLDGAEVHCAHGYLPAQFLSPNANKREDDYGGTFENRARFIMEILSAIRSRVSKTFAVGIRVAPDFVVNGVGPEENLKLAQLAEGLALIDFVDVSAGNYQSFPKMIGGMHEPLGYELPSSNPITRQVKSPTIVIGRIRTLEEADQIIRAGEADMVGMTRAHIADPDLVRKTLDGHSERVRPCIACNQGCVGNLLGPSHRMGCAVNPAVGFERTVGDHLLVPAATAKLVYVVGGGPAGMEAARVAALRGHKVMLVEAEAKLGGALKLAARAPTRQSFRDFTVWQEDEIFRLGVEVRLSTYVDIDDVMAERPDYVIVATGSTPRMDGIQLSNPGEPIEGFDQPHVVSSHDIFAEPGRDRGRSAVVVDDVGHYEAIAVSEQLLNQGMEVTFVTRHTAFAPLIETALMTEPALTRLSKGRFETRLRTRAVAVSGKSVIVLPTYLERSSNKSETLPADTVVFVSTNHANRALHSELTERGVKASIVGDASTPRHLQSAVREGHLAGVAA